MQIDEPNTDITMCKTKETLLVSETRYTVKVDLVILLHSIEAIRSQYDVWKNMKQNLKGRTNRSLCNSFSLGWLLINQH